MNKEQLAQAKILEGNNQILQRILTHLEDGRLNISVSRVHHADILDHQLEQAITEFPAIRKMTYTLIHAALKDKMADNEAALEAL